MKKTLHFMGLTLLAAAALLSCSRETLPETDTPTETPEVTPVETEKPTTHTIHIKADGDDTRTQIVGTAARWTPGDKLFVYQGYWYGKEWCQEAKVSQPGEMLSGGAQMSFEVNFDYVDPDYVNSGWTEDDEPFNFLYHAVYPAENAALYEEGGACFLLVDLPSKQYPELPSFDPKSDILTARPAYLLQQPDDLSLSFKRQTALGQMTVKGLPEGIPVEMVAFLPRKADGSCPFKDLFALLLPSGDELGWSTDGAAGVYLYTPGRTVPAADGDNPTAFMTPFMCNPFSLTAGDAFQVAALSTVQVTDETTGEQVEMLSIYSKDVVLGEGLELVFTAGDATIFAVNMSGIEPMAIPVFELMFDEDTQANFPHITDETDPYMEIPYVLEYDGENVGVSFMANHPWTVSFSEPWLYVIESEGDAGYGAFRVYADTNDTGSPREATMTIASMIYGEVTVRVVQEAMVVPDFELKFAERTFDEFPELEDGRLELPFRVGGGSVEPKKTRADVGDFIDLYFETNHPWTVRFSESWLSASPSSGNPSYTDNYGNVQYGYFNIYATPNGTGASREATMTIASQYFGEVTIRVVQDKMVLPNSITINAPQTVTPYSFFDVEAVLGYPDGVDRGLEANIAVVEGSGNLRWISGGYLPVNPGTVTFRAYLSHDVCSYLDEDFYLESEAAVVTITEGPAPTDWYFANNRPYGAYLTHFAGGQRSSAALSTLRTSTANDLAFSADRSKIYVVGSVVLTIDVDEEREEPRLWTYDCATGTVDVTKLDYPSGRGKKVAVDETNGDVYVLVDASSEDVSNRYCLLKNNEQIWETSMLYVISDLAVENGKYYLCGNTEFRNFANGTDPIVWKNGSMMFLQEYVPSNDRIQPYFEPKSICVLNGVPYTVGLMPVSNNEWRYFEYPIMWENNEYMYSPDLRTDIEGLRQIPRDMVLLKGAGFDPDYPPILVVGEQQRSSTENSTPGLYLNRPFYNDNSYRLPLTYSGSASIQNIRLCNGIPALLGTNSGRPAYWSAPWSTPTSLSLGEEETFVGFLVK